MRILIDCDGVLADFVGGVVDALNTDSLKSMGYSARPRYDSAMVTRWGIAECLGVPEKRVWDIVSQPGFCAGLLPIAGARECLDVLRSFADVYAVTSPVWSSPYWMHERTRWLKDMMGFDWDHIVHTSSKHILTADVLIDDKASTIRTWCETGARFGVLLSRPWNEHEPIPGTAKRLGEWVELIDVLGGTTAA